MRRTDFIAAVFFGGSTEKAKAELYRALGCRQKVDSKAMDKIDARLAEACGHRGADLSSLHRFRERIKLLKGDTWRLMEEACGPND